MNEVSEHSRIYVVSREICFTVNWEPEDQLWVLRANNIGGALLNGHCEDLNHVQSVADDLSEGYFELLKEGEPDGIQRLETSMVK